MADGRPVDSDRARRGDRHPRALRPRVAGRPGGERVRDPRPADRPLRAARRARRRPRGRGQPLRPRGPVPGGVRRGGEPRARGRALPHRARPGLARARPRPVLRHRAGLRRGLPRRARLLVAPGSRRRGGAAGAGDPGGRRRVRPRRRRRADGGGLPGVLLRGLRPPRGVDRGRAGARRRPRSVRPRALRRGRRHRVPRRGPGPGVLLRLAARHGRPGGRGPPRARGARPRRRVSGGRALRRGRRRRQPQPRGPPLLRLLHPGLHARLPVAARTRGPRDAGGRGAAAAVLEEAGFASVRRAAETPFNLVLEARPVRRSRAASAAEPEFGRPAPESVPCMDDTEIRDVVKRLFRPHSSGGDVIERVAILAAGGDPRRSWRGSPPTTARPRRPRPRRAAVASTVRASRTGPGRRRRRRPVTCCRPARSADAAGLRRGSIGGR